MVKFFKSLWCYWIGHRIGDECKWCGFGTRYIHHDCTNCKQPTFGTEASYPNGVVLCAKCWFEVNGDKTLTSTTRAT